MNRELSGVLLSMAGQADSELCHGPKLNHDRGGIDCQSSRLSCVECVVATNESGHIIRKDEAVDGAVHTWLYGYDAEGRLAFVRRDGKVVEKYTYDALGRRLEDRCEAFGGQIRRFVYNDADQLLSAGDVSYDYDTLGRLCARKGPQGASTYEYDAVGGLFRVSLPGGCVVEFANDGEGKPLEKYVDGVLVARFAWLDFLRLHTLNDLTKKTFMTLHYQDGKRLPYAATMSEGGYAYDCSLGLDQVGTLKVVADSNCDVIKKIEYDSFGNVLCDKRPQLDLPLGFAGGVMDRDTGLVRFGWRYYLPEVGRFIAPDPARWRGGDPDVYEYCVDDPVNKIDPCGLWPWSDEKDDTAPREVWVWRSSQNACDKCKALDGTVVDDPRNPDRPHPNCKCSIIKCTRTIKYTDWKVYLKGKPHYEVHVKSCDVAGAPSFAIWKKIVVVREKREKIVSFIAHDGWKIIVKRKKEYRERKKIKTKTTTAIRWDSGTSADQGDVWTANNPWTGETVGRRY